MVSQVRFVSFEKSDMIFLRLPLTCIGKFPLVEGVNSSISAVVLRKINFELAFSKRYREVKLRLLKN